MCRSLLKEMSDWFVVMLHFYSIACLGSNVLKQMQSTDCFYCVTSSLYSQFNNTSFFMFEWLVSHRHQNLWLFQWRNSQHSFCILSWDSSYSLSFLWLCLFSWKYVTRFESWTVFSWKSLSFFFFGCGCFSIFASWWNFWNHHVVLLSPWSRVVHWSSVFNRVIDKLVFHFYFLRFSDWAGEERVFFFHPASYPCTFVFLSFQFHPTCFRRVLFMTSIWK